MKERRWLVLAALALLAFASPLYAQGSEEDWQSKWFWGVKGGAFNYRLSFGRVFDPMAGAEWLITGRRTALYLAFSRAQFTNPTVASITGLSPDTISLSIRNANRIEVAVLALPVGGALQPYVGGGFTIETLPDVVPLRTLSSANQATLDRELRKITSGGFGLYVVGLQLRIRRVAFFGHYQYSPQGQSFLLEGGSHALEFGVRYALTAAREEDLTTRR